MAFRRGRRLVKVETRMQLDTVGAAGWLKQGIDRERPAKVFIDVGGVGAGVYDQLQHMGPPYAETVEAVNFGSPPFEPAPLDELGRPSGGPLNRRAEIWGKSKEWLELPGGVQIPDSDALQADACGPGYRYDSPHAAGARAQGGHAPARRQEPGRVGRGGAHLRQAGGGAGAEEAEQFPQEAGVSADRVGVRGGVAGSCSYEGSRGGS